MYCGVMLDSLVGMRIEAFNASSSYMKRKMQVVRGVIGYALLKWRTFTVAVQNIWNDLRKGHIENITFISMVFGSPSKAEGSALVAHPAVPLAPVAENEENAVLGVDRNHDDEGIGAAAALVQPSGDRGSTRPKHRAGKARTAKKKQKKAAKGRDGRTPGFDPANVKA